MFQPVKLLNSLSRLLEFHFSEFEISHLIKLTELCISHTYFSFNENFFQQTDGLAMGNPLSPILCDIYMHFVETKILELCQFSFWTRYVDNVFAIFKNVDSDPSQYLQILNSIDPHIQFTFEFENDGSLPFLDVLVTKTSSNFETSVFRKLNSVNLPPPPPL